MGRSPSCSKEGLNRGAWTAAEDRILTDYIKAHGDGRWRSLPKKAGLKRCGKSCRLRWLNYLRPDIKRGNISADEEDLIIRLHKLLGNRWSLIAGRLPGRTDNEIKNYWNTNLCKRVQDHHQYPRRKSVFDQQKVIKKAEIYQPQSKMMKSQLVFRTKATKCYNVFLDPIHQPLRKQHFETSSNSTETGHSIDKNHWLNNNKPVDSDTYNGLLSSLVSCNQDQPDIMIDFNLGEFCFSDLLNSNLSDFCDHLNYSNDNNSNDQSSPDSDQALMFSDDQMLHEHDWRVSESTVGIQANVDSNLQSFSSFLDADEVWLGE